MTGERRAGQSADRFQPVPHFLNGIAHLIDLLLKRQLLLVEQCLLLNELLLHVNKLTPFAIRLVIKFKQRFDFCKRQTHPLSPKDDLKPYAITRRIKARCASPFRMKQVLILVKPQRPQRNIELTRQFTNREHWVTIISASRVCWLMTTACNHFEHQKYPPPFLLCLILSHN